MEDNSENILVEFDYQNISVIDPNKVIDQEGKVKERLIKQEDLVFYANLECSVLPRTKLAIGVPQSETVRTVSVAKLNFLNPGFKKFLDEVYYDELTGKKTLEGKGINQPKQTATKNPELSDDYYINQTILTDGKEGATDTGLLGITNINIDYGTDFMPVISITFEDIKGRALFEAGNSSPYAAFFQLPYPIFYLTIKGYLGKAVRLPLMLHTFSSSFDPSSHNFRINCQFYTYKYTIMSEVSWAAMYAVPSMYQVTIKTQDSSTTNPNGGNSQVSTTTSSLGIQKMKELYSEYKAKGLIDDTFPEITVLQLKEKLEQLITNIENNFKKKNLDVLNALETYSENLSEYASVVYLYGGLDSWARKWLDFENVFIKNDKKKTVLYKYKPEFKDVQKKSDAISELQGIISKYNNLLLNNVALGKKISVPIDLNLFFYNVNISEISITETFTKRYGTTFSGVSTSQEYIDFRNTLNTEIIDYSNVGTYPGLAFFEGDNSFAAAIEKINEKYLTEKKTIEDTLTKEIQAEFANPDNGLGFQPTIRNILAVIFAQGEAFLRMLDDVHTKAWDLRDDANRKKAVYNANNTIQSVDVKPGEYLSPIYPWPQVITETFEDGKEKYELKYPGDSDIATKINAYSPEIWPEVQFVEEFLRGYTQVSPPQFPTGPTGNFIDKPNRFSFNALEFTIGNDVYQNTEEVKFFYEIWERMFVNSFYSKMNRDSVKQYSIQNYVAESETTDMLQALSDDNPFIAQKLKQYNINSQIYGGFLRHISNGGEGESWQNFIRGIFNTPYLKNDADTSFYFYKSSILQNNKALPSVGLVDEEPSVKYFGGDKVSDDFDFTDLYPLTSLDWCKNYLANGKAVQNTKDVFKTSDTLQYDKSIKTIRNKDVLPIVNFNYKSDVFNQILDLSNLKTFYKNRKIEKQYATEGNIFYTDYNTNLVAEQTTSMLNTPYFTNAIQKGVFDFRYSLVENSPYKSAAYLFLNSLPLGTLRDKYKTYNSDGTTSTNSYILPSLKKFGAVHKVPYAWVLKYGSIWHRYKKYVEDGIDILDDVWTDTDYVGNYDPAFSSTTTQYNLQINGLNYDLILDGVNVTGLIDKSIINTGFYPKLLDDFNVFLQGNRLFSQTSTIQGTYYVTGNTLEVVSLNYIGLEPGLIFSGASFFPGTQIVTQLTGTSGGTGTYLIEPSQLSDIIPPSSPQTFEITNKPIPGFQNASIQNALNDKFRMVLSSSALINKGIGFDLTDLNRSLTLLPWSCYIETTDNTNIYPLPSLGSNVNQTTSECFSFAGNIQTEVSNNPSVHNGSCRVFWKAPQYGYFDNSKITKPLPDEYVREIYTQQEEQQNFAMYGETNQYSKISELLTTFNYDILNQFEEQFLLFSRSVYDFESNLTPSDGVVTAEAYCENFQQLIRTMLKTQNPVGLTGNALIDKIADNQKDIIQKTIETFMDYQVVFKYGNPSNFDKKLFYTFSNDFIEDPYTWGGYLQNSPGALPSQGGTITLAQSKTQNPDIWKKLETYVGFSEIPELQYTDNGSYITDFFIEMDVEFSETNIEQFAPIIKMYATQKLKTPNIDMESFFNLMGDYIQKGETYLNLILDNTLTSVRAKLGNISINASSTGVKYTDYIGDISRYEMWDSFKSINDKWISGADLRSKTLFEDLLIVDRASRDVGQKIFVDIFKLKDQIQDMNYANNMLGMINTIFENNNFRYFILPAYANFYNVQDVSKNPTPRPEGTLEFAKSLFGTHLNVDYRETGAKILAIYAHKTSEYLAMNTNTDYKYRDDAFDLRRASDNPLTENQDGKTNWDKSNKVVGFNVDFGPQNQQIFKQIDIGQTVGQPTAESLEMLNQMSNQYRNRGGASQSVSLYNIYRNRSYKCSIDMMGCALVQPLMYFNLRNIPMFSGPYMIEKVTHRIDDNGFNTTIEGVRQPFYSIPAIDSLLQSLSTTILSAIKERIEEDKKEATTQAVNNLSQTANATNNATATDNKTVQPSTVQGCSGGLNAKYTDFTTTGFVGQSLDYKNAIKKISSITASQATTNDSYNTNVNLLNFIFTVMYLSTDTGVSFFSYNNNFANVDLTLDYGGAETYFTKNYFCTTNANNQKVPFADFKTFNDFVNFVIVKVKPKITVSDLINILPAQVEYPAAMAKFIVDKWPNENVGTWDLLSQDVKNKYIENVTNSLMVVRNNIEL